MNVIATPVNLGRNRWMGMIQKRALSSTVITVFSNKINYQLLPILTELVINNLLKR